ncbi:MAG: 2-amino-4-hydroxy-6-hydroxymethyldihydropteridine diphosphokinase [Leptolyngbyaceae cyanobacterium]
MNSISSAIALGSNLGDSLGILQGAIAELEQHHAITLVRCSRLYRTSPVGPPQPDYLNACAVLQSGLPPDQLLELLLAIEVNFGRVRQERWGPRRLDLDLLLFGQQVIATPTLQVPHPRMWERAFVLVPLAEIASDWSDPISGRTVADFRAAIADQEVVPLVDVPLLGKSRNSEHMVG